ncbi:hypothetical protein AQUSIP_05370 [Aquicella siphonis]|uniref:Glycosyltransferase RgtA/B/C/D-like domain-containing protein n=1 Tax=Aquicella siphonis TaxID=254247 RepID=A0A5E4PE48_9COXI|nr:glycosyltransferase family 39 protein [Aquicella siphonis]VVC75249.1 hypothetical protein AQUSIP_05370 [Aquicella siphonis]
MNLSPSHANRWLSLFLCAHLLLWTLAPALLRYNLPLDAIEGTIWGHQLEWGYDKNPFLNGWLTALAVYFDRYSGWVIYLFSQICVVTGLWAVWRLAREMLTPAHALISVMLLEGIQYYNFHAIDFNDNTLELCLWPLAVYYFYRALRSSGYMPWLLTGVFAGLGMMAKYYTSTLLAGMGLFLLTHSQHWKHFSRPGPYLGLTAFLLIILPHGVWLFQHDFITIHYVIERGRSAPGWINHILYPAAFTLEQLEAFLPALVLYSMLYLGKENQTPPQQDIIGAFNQAFLFYIGIMPLLLTLMLSVLFGTKLRAGWGMPLLSTWGIILTASLRPALSRKQLYCFIACVFLLMGVMITGYSIRLLNTSSLASANYPGQEMARAITQLWHERYHTRLEYVGGPRWIGGNIGFYSPDHPAVFVEWNKRRAPWVSLDDLREKGAVFVWDMNQAESVPEDIRKEFPRLLPPVIKEFVRHRSKNISAPVRIGIAFLPPQTRADAILPAAPA